MVGRGGVCVLMRGTEKKRTNSDWKERENDDDDDEVNEEAFLILLTCKEWKNSGGAHSKTHSENYSNAHFFYSSDFDFLETNLKTKIQKSLIIINPWKNRNPLRFLSQKWERKKSYDCVHSNNNTIKIIDDRKNEECPRIESQSNEYEYILEYGNEEREDEMLVVVLVKGTHSK